MTTIATRAERIAELEGFNLVVRIGSDFANPSANGVLGPYPYDKAALNRWTVREWREKRFEATYDGFTCDVLTADGSKAPGKATLEEVRNSYSG